MADDNVDISGMPDPGTIGLDHPVKQVDPTAGMPAPEDLYRKAYGYGPRAQSELDEFMANPHGPLSARDTVSALSGVPRAVAGYAAAVPAGVASIAGQATGALGAALDPEHAGGYLEQGRERGRQWSEKVSKLADYVPATAKGAETSEALLGLPGKVIQDTAGAGLKAALPDNAYQAVADVAQDIGTDLPALGAPGMARAGARVATKAAKTVKRVYDAGYSANPAAPPTEAPITPPVGKPITGDSLRAQPNPIPPPEGTVAHAKSAKVVPAPSPNEISPPAQQEGAPAPPSAAPTPSAATPSPGGAQRGSVRLFSSPAEEGPKETPAPEQQSERAGHLDAIDKLSGGLLPTRRTSALTGDYNATGDDWQMKEVGNEKMRTQMASENAAMHTAADNVHASIGSEFENSVDSQTLGDRGRVARGAIQGIEKHFDDATDGVYEAAREQNQGRPIAELKRVKAYLDDDSNFTNDAEIGLQRAAKQRLERLWSTGDPDKGAPPGSVNAAERLREFLNEKGKNPQAMGVAGDLKGHLDLDVAEHGGPGLFEAARALRRHKYQMLEEPTGIKKLLTPGDSQGINHAIPEHKVMDYIADLPREQHEHVLNVLRAGAHLGEGELAEQSAAALREIQAHVVSRMHAAARNADGSWNARKFYNAADRYARNAPETFRDRPDVLSNLKTINDAGNTLHLDKHYPGAAAQTERTGAIGHALEAGGQIAASIAHEVPVIGRYVGRRIENAVDRASGKIGDSARDRAVASRLVDRNGKQRGSVGVLPQRDAINHKEATGHGEGTIGHLYGVPNRGGNLHAVEYPEFGVTKVRTSSVVDKGKGWGTRMLQRAVDDAHARGQVLRSDEQVSEGQAGAYSNLKKLGYDVVKKPSDLRGGAYKSFGDHVFEVRPGRSKVPSGQRGSVRVMNESPDASSPNAGIPEDEGSGAQVNIGLHQGTEGQPGFRKMSKQEAQAALEAAGAKVTKTSVLTPKAHGVAEPTLVASLDRPLAHDEMQKVLAKTKQSAIPQRAGNGDESMHIAPGHEETAKEQGWRRIVKRLAK